MKFLDERQATIAIKALFSTASQAKIAVAFWGAGAAGRLGLDRPGLDLDIVCNLESGACNPAEIRTLQTLTSPNRVRSDPRLHGKVYWTPTSVMLGSSNASTNGLVVEGAALAGWAEANILTSDSEMIEAAYAWFEARRSVAHEIDETHLKIAEQLWRARRENASPGSKLDGDLLTTYRNSPNNPAWAKLKLAIWNEGLSKRGSQALKEEPLIDSALQGLDAYEGWHDRLAPGDRLLDFEVDGDLAAFTSYWTVPDPILATKLLTYVRSAPTVELPGFGPMTLSETDRERFAEVAPALARRESHDGSAVVPFAEAVKFLDERASVAADPSQAVLSALEQAMRGIYTEAARMKYYPNDYMRMLDHDGALATAKRLVNSPNISSGFTQLFELGRLDLTVEALILRPPWNALFSKDERDRARRRLGR